MLFMLVGTSSMHAQDFNPRKRNYLILSQQLQQLKPILLTAHELGKEDGKKHGDFYVILCGKTVSDIPGDAAFYRLLEEAKNQKVTIFVCGLSLKKFNIDPAELPKGLQIIENGILYGFQLSKKGFITLSI